MSLYDKFRECVNYGRDVHLTEDDVNNMSIDDVMIAYILIGKGASIYVNIHMLYDQNYNLNPKFDYNISSLLICASQRECNREICTPNGHTYVYGKIFDLKQ